MLAGQGVSLQVWENEEPELWGVEGVRKGKARGVAGGVEKIEAVWVPMSTPMLTSPSTSTT